MGETLRRSASIRRSHRHRERRRDAFSVVVVLIVRALMRTFRKPSNLITSPVAVNSSFVLFEAMVTTVFSGPRPTSGMRSRFQIRVVEALLPRIASFSIAKIGRTNGTVRHLAQSKVLVFIDGGSDSARRSCS